MIKYFVYVRKSTDVEDKQVRSIEDQLAVLDDEDANRRFFRELPEGLLAGSQSLLGPLVFGDVLKHTTDFHYLPVDTVCLSNCPNPNAVLFCCNQLQVDIERLAFLNGSSHCYGNPAEYLRVIDLLIGELEVAATLPTPERYIPLVLAGVACSDVAFADTATVRNAAVAIHAMDGGAFAVDLARLRASAVLAHRRVAYSGLGRHGRAVDRYVDCGLKRGRIRGRVGSQR